LATKVLVPNPEAHKSRSPDRHI